MNDYKATLEQIKYMTQEQPEIVDQLEDFITKLEKDKNTYLKQLLDTRHELVQKDYAVQNQLKVIESTGKTLERYETENKALRSLVNLWI